MHKPTW